MEVSVMHGYELLVDQIIGERHQIAKQARLAREAFEAIEEYEMDNESWVPVLRGYPIDTFYARRSDTRSNQSKSRDEQPALRRLFHRIARRPSAADRKSTRLNSSHSQL